MERRKREKERQIQETDTVIDTDSKEFTSFKEKKCCGTMLSTQKEFKQYLPN